MTIPSMKHRNYICRINCTCPLSCNADITPHRINTTPHNFVMFPPTTTAAIHSRRGQEQRISAASSSRRTSSWLRLCDDAAGGARGGGSSHNLLLGAIEFGRGGGTKSNNAYTPCCLPFASVGGGEHLWEPTPCPPSLTPQNQHTNDLLRTGALLSLLILQQQKGPTPRGREPLGPLMTLMMMVINMMMTMILSQ